MKQRGRKSAASLAALSIDGQPLRLDPPADLSDAERNVFVEVTNACGSRHFVASDLPLLVSFAQTTVIARGAATSAASDLQALAVWEKAVRLQAMLATRLRLSPQSRLDPKTVARRHWDGDLGNKRVRGQRSLGSKGPPLGTTALWRGSWISLSRSILILPLKEEKTGKQMPWVVAPVYGPRVPYMAPGVPNMAP